MSSDALTHALFERHIQGRDTKEPVVIVLILSIIDTVLVQRILHERDGLWTAKGEITKNGCCIVDELWCDLGAIGQLSEWLKRNTGTHSRIDEESCDGDGASVQ